MQKFFFHLNFRRRVKKIRRSKQISRAVESCTVRIVGDVVRRRQHPLACQSNGADRFFVFLRGSISRGKRIGRRGKRERNRRRFAAKPKILMSAGMLKPGISFGGLPGERYSRLEATPGHERSASSVRIFG